MSRIAITTAVGCRHHLFHRDQLARLVTFFDRWVVLIRPSEDDGTTALVRQLQRRHPSRVRVVEFPHGWQTVAEAWRCALVDLRPEVEEWPGTTYVWRVEPCEVWEASAVIAAERELEHRRGSVGSFRTVPYVGPRLRVVGEWADVPIVRLWRWDGRLLDPDSAVDAVRLAPRVDVHALAFQSDVEAWAAGTGFGYVATRWQRLQQRGADLFPVPLADLFGPAAAGLTRSEIHHDDQPHVPQS